MSTDARQQHESQLAKALEAWRQVKDFQLVSPTDESDYNRLKDLAKLLRAVGLKLRNSVDTEFDAQRGLQTREVLGELLIKQQAALQLIKQVSADTLAQAPQQQQQQQHPVPQQQQQSSSVTPTGAQRYVMVKQVQSTIFGKVVIAQDLVNQAMVAIKCSKQSAMGAARDTKTGVRVLEDVAMELRVLKKLNQGQGHPNIVRLLDQFQDERYIYTVLEMMDQGELLDALLQCKRFKDSVCRSFFTQMLNGVGHIHANGFCHLDLSPENLLLNSKWEAKICDFGLARVCNPHPSSSSPSAPPTSPTLPLATPNTHAHAQSQTQTDPDPPFQGEPDRPPGKPNYMAPEIYAGRSFRGQRADIWSMGVILFVMVVGRWPYEQPTMADRAFARVIAGDVAGLLRDWGMLAKVEDARVCDLMTRMMSPPETRWSLAQVAAHPWVLGPAASSSAAPSSSSAPATAPSSSSSSRRATSNPS